MYLDHPASRLRGKPAKHSKTSQFRRYGGWPLRVQKQATWDYCCVRFMRRKHRGHSEEDRDWNPSNGLLYVLSSDRPRATPTRAQRTTFLPRHEQCGAGYSCASCKHKRHSVLGACPGLSRSRPKSDPVPQRKRLRSGALLCPLHRQHRTKPTSILFPRVSGSSTAS